MTETETPRVYVADLSAYNAGELRGVWIDVTPDADAMAEAIAGMLQESPYSGAEEWRIDDVENVPRRASSLSELAAFATLIEIHGYDVARLFVDANVCDADDWESEIDDWYFGIASGSDEVDAVAQYGWEMDSLEIPEHLDQYRDAIYRAWASDAINGGEIDADRASGDDWIIHA